MAISGTTDLNNAEQTVIVSGSVAVTGPLTDAQLRATPVPISITARNVTLGGFTATNTSQIALAANSSRRYLILHNPSGNTLWFAFGTAAVNAPPSIELRPNNTFIMESTFISGQAIHVIRAGAANVTFTIGEG